MISKHYTNTAQTTLKSRNTIQTHLTCR